MRKQLPVTYSIRFKNWLNIAGRLLLWELVGGYALLSIYIFIQRLEGPNPGADFVIYYGASLLSLANNPAAIFDWSAMAEAQASVIGEAVKYLPWLYPPPLLLLAAPLAGLPYIPALGVWILGQFALLLIAIRSLISRHNLGPLAYLAAFVFPATVNNMLAGQNGALSAALLGGGLAVLQRRPVLAGLLFGLLIYKPHLGIMLPFALLAMGAWRTIAAALSSAICISLVSLLAFGTAPWLGFFQSAGVGANALEYGQTHWAKMATVFAALRLAGADLPLAYAGQAIAAILAILAVLYLWRRKTADLVSLPIRASGLLFATFLATPYAFFYDLVVLIFPILWLGSMRWLPGCRQILGLLWVAPVALWLLARYSQISLWPIVLAGCLIWLLYHNKQQRQ
ncbi:MAG: DUF2029 domain-containing protein [Rhodospirillaceae bacterium]|nr:DUF2029 domain-containing protein [Rhodospirillaceae bacterium]MBT4690423.1 DUF2029 domain-containing protein [Rhodospirillaceae bacterium]MBT5083956.1 DUF2029 domain-containing protein [Rhodospirillaceae bacterium]MBT5882233.1 DUF2029 domain-containing protein [Rhodospirillaceae bacterium]MBT6588990.1 DUF2029 domain-containing protein [Rhodospirillaceae bacterium]